MKCERLYDTVIVSRGWRSVLCVQTPAAHLCAIFLLSSWATNQLTSGNPTLISCAEPVHVLAGRDYESFFSTSLLSVSFGLKCVVHLAS